MAARCATRRSPALRGFTLVEMLIVVALLAIVGRIMAPALSDSDERRLDAAAVEVREALRFARAEALRRAKKTLVDAESAPGRVKVFWLSGSGCNVFGGPSAATDPRTKSAFNVAVSSGAFSDGVTVTPRFMGGGSAWGGVVFDADGAAGDACQVSGMVSKGALEAGSGVMLSLGARSVSVNLDAATGRVTGP